MAQNLGKSHLRNVKYGKLYDGEQQVLVFLKVIWYANKCICGQKVVICCYYYWGGSGGGSGGGSEGGSGVAQGWITIRWSQTHPQIHSHITQTPPPPPTPPPHTHTRTHRDNLFVEAGEYLFFVCIMYLIMKVVWGICTMHVFKYVFLQIRYCLHIHVLHVLLCEAMWLYMY